MRDLEDEKAVMVNELAPDLVTQLREEIREQSKLMENAERPHRLEW